MKKHLSLLIKFFLWLGIINSNSINLYSSDSLNIKPGSFQMEEYISCLQNKKIGLVINNGSLVDNKNLADTLTDIGIRIEKIFTPEHGFSSNIAAGEVVGNDTYGIDSIPVISLYGKTKKPSKSDILTVEIVLFDLQDVGVRFYTYISTLHYVMEACAENGIPLIVLDRPNPNGFYIDGPILEDKYKSFVGLHPVPVVYGMTIGEYAQMINGENWLPDSLKCNLTIIKCKNYIHTSYYNLPVNPSPNLREMRSIYLYPTLAFFEGTVVSEGRGTQFPFLAVGHPDYPDHSFSFIPEPGQGVGLNPRFNGKVCFGQDFRKYSLDSLKSNGGINLKIIIDFYSGLKLGESFFTSYFNTLAGTDILKTMIIQGKSEKEIRNSWKSGLEEFKKIRIKYLLYPDFGY